MPSRVNSYRGYSSPKCICNGHVTKKTRTNQDYATYNGILHAMNEMRLTMSHVPCSHRLHQTRVPTDSYHTMPKPMHDKIHNSWITSNDYFTKQISFIFKPKSFWMFTSMIICFQKSMCLLWVVNFPGSHRRIRKPSHTFTGFHRWIHMYNQKDNESFTQHIISFSIFKPCNSIWTLSHFLSPHNQHQTQC